MASTFPFNIIFERYQKKKKKNLNAETLWYVWLAYAKKNHKMNYKLDAYRYRIRFMIMILIR